MNTTKQYKHRKIQNSIVVLMLPDGSEAREEFATFADASKFAIASGYSYYITTP